jgi:hypothetical protein
MQDVNVQWRWNNSIAGRIAVFVVTIYESRMFATEAYA